jgi:RNA polymerase sigma factor (sigma-70 family)
VPEGQRVTGIMRGARTEEGPKVTRANSEWPTEHVITAAQGGDERAIALLISGSHTHVRRFAHTLCATPEDAEEATQEALLVLYRKIGTLRVAAALASWTFQIVLRECMRRTHLAFRVASVHAEDEPSAEDVALARLEMERMVSAVAALPPDQRAAVVLRDIQGLSGGATAEALGLSRAAMKSRLHRGRETLRRGLREPKDLTADAGAGHA